MRDLGSTGFDESSVTAQLGHPGFKRAARAGAGKEEQHRQHFIAQVSVFLAQSALALQVPGYIQDGFNFFFAEV